jgi:outer membrane receptor protein involved in Fe transport
VDELKYTIGFSDIYKELQHGTVVRDIPVGAANYSNQALLQYINFEKANIAGKLGVVINSSFVQGKLARLDSTKNYYDWYGNVSSVRNSSGAELSRQPSNADIDRILFSNRINLSYKLSDRHELAFSNFYGQQKRTGKDDYGIRIAGKDPLTEPAIIKKNVSGLAYTSQWLDDKMTAVLSLKHYYYAASSATVTDVYATEFPVTTIQGNLPGYNLAVRYQLSEQMSVKASYERTLRIPDETELFGDFIDVGANPDLKPERSNNLNLSFQWEKRIRDRYITTDFNAFYRKQNDLIFLFIPPIGLGFYKNQNDAVAFGADFMAEVQPLKSFSFQASVTYQDVRVVSNSFEDKDYDGNRIPNIPWLFFNISPRYTTKKLLREDDRLQLFAYFQYINEFPFILEGQSRNDAVYVPTQQLVSTGVSYSILNDRITATLQANNIFDEKAFDNRSIQKPGRNFNLKLRYLIN